MLLKKIAQKIMQSKIEEMQCEINGLRKDALNQSEDWSKTLKETSDLVKKQQNKIDELNDQIKDLKYQNDILRQYYHLDEEPSEEIQTKMRIDMRCHDLERELDRQRVIVDISRIAFPMLPCNQIANARTMMEYPLYRLW